jgi:hypothetical protein
MILSFPVFLFVLSTNLLLLSKIDTVLFTLTITVYTRIGNANAILPMTAVASAGAYLLSTPVDLGPNTRGEPRRQPQRGTSEGCWRRRPGRAGGYPPGPPTDPDVRHERIRFLKQSRCCPCKDTLAPQSPGLLWVGLVSSESLPCIPASGGSARRRLPSRGSLGPHFPTCTRTLRRYDCPLPVSSRCAWRSLPDTLSASVVRALPYGLIAGRTLPVTLGPVVTRSPNPGMSQGDRRLSHVPAFPL